MMSRVIVPTDILKAAVEKISLASPMEEKSLRSIGVFGSGDSLLLVSNSNALDTEILIKELNPHDPFSSEVSGPLLRSLVPLLPGAETEIVVGDGMVIRSGKAEFKLAEKVPEKNLPRSNASSLSPMTADIGDLFSSFGKVAYSTSEGQKPYSGVIVVDGERLFAADGHRMATFPNTQINHAGRLVLKTNVVSALAKIFKGVGSIGGIAVTPSHLVISCGGITTSARLMTVDKIPDFRSVVSKDIGLAVRFEKQGLQTALSRCLVVADNSSPRATLYFDNGVVVLQSEHAGNVNRDELPCDYRGESLIITINATYLLQAVRAVEDNTGRVILEIRGESRPVIIRDSEGSHINVIQPIDRKN